MFEPKIEQCLEERATTLPVKAYRGILPRIELPFVPCCGENEGSEPEPISQNDVIPKFKWLCQGRRPPAVNQWWPTLVVSTRIP